MMNREQEALRVYLTDAQWEVLRLLPDVGRMHPVGRKPSEDRQVLDAVFWVMLHQARWQELPINHPSPRTCQRRLKRWMRSGTWTLLWRDYLHTLDEAGLAMWREPFEILAMREARGGDHRIGRPPFWRAAAIDYWWFTWDLQPTEVRHRLHTVVEPLMTKHCH
ncbi:MAG: transposase [Phycisphaeraceae bacterium]